MEVKILQLLFKLAIIDEKHHVDALLFLDADNAGVRFPGRIAGATGTAGADISVKVSVLTAEGNGKMPVIVGVYHIAHAGPEGDIRGV